VRRFFCVIGGLLEVKARAGYAPTRLWHSL
jgi:hypothetical protein